MEVLKFNGTFEIFNAMTKWGPVLSEGNALG